MAPQEDVNDKLLRASPNEMRKESFQHLIDEKVELRSEPEKLTIRDEKSIKRITSGLLKILCPHGEIGNDELKMCLDIAVEYRQRVVDWLHQLSPGEFKGKENDV